MKRLALVQGHPETELAWKRKPLREDSSADLSYCVSAFKIPKAIDHRVWLRFPVQALVDAKLTRQQLRTLAAICMHLNEQYQTFVGHAAVARILGISRESAGRHYRALLKARHIRRTARKGRGYITEVRFTNPKAEELFRMTGRSEDAISVPYQKQVEPSEGHQNLTIG